MSSWNLTIPFVAGEDKKNGMYRIHNLMMESAKAQGFENEPVKPKRPASQIWQQLQSQGVEQRVKMELIKPGQRVNLARARRTFSPEFAETVVNYEFATGDDQLDEIFKRIAPELSDADIERMSDASSARKRAFDASIDGLVGVDSKIRNRQVSTSDKFLKSYIIGHAPARAGKTLDEQRRRELQDLVKASLGDLGIMEDKGMSRLLRHRIQSRPILMNERVETEFRAMIHAYHEVRRHNAPYLQAMMGGMDGAQDPEGLITALIPSPDDIMRGTIAHMIIDLNAVPEGGTLVTGKLSGLLNFVRDKWRKILNVKRPAGAVSATTKQQSVARLLAMTGGRKKTVSAIENAVNKAQTRGADFIRAFKTMRPKQIDEESIRRMITPRDTPSNITISESNMTGVNSFFGGKETNIFSRTSKVAKEKGYTRYLQELMQAMEKQGLVYPIGGRLVGKLPAAPAGENRFFMPRGREEPTGELLPFVILPMELPSFTRFPTGWDRRWMVATMRVIDEYWDFIYSGEGILLSNLLYLIVSRAEELFQYRMDPTEITQLAILLSKDSSQAEVIEAVAEEEQEEGDQEEDEEVGGFEGGREDLDYTREELQAELAAIRGGYDDDFDTDMRYEDDDDGARRRARRGGIMPTPRDKSSEMLYRPLKTLSRLVTNSGQAQLAKTRVEKLAGKIERLERRDARNKTEITNKRSEVVRLKEQLEEAKEEMEELQEELEKYAVFDTADEEILTAEESREYIDNLLLNLNNIKTLESYKTGKSRATFQDDSPFVKQVDDAIDRLSNSKDTIRFPINEALWVKAITKDAGVPESAVRELLGEIERVPLRAGGRVARSYAQSGQRSILARVYAEVSVPRTRNLKKNLQSAMLDLYAMMYDEAKDISGAKKLKNIEIGMVNIGEDIFQFYGEADVIGPSKKKKSNPPVRNAPFDGAARLEEIRRKQRADAETALQKFASDYIDERLENAMMAQPGPTFSFILGSEGDYTGKAIFEDYRNLEERFGGHASVKNRLGLIYNGKFEIAIGGSRTQGNSWRDYLRFSFTPNSEVRSEGQLLNPPSDKQIRTKVKKILSKEGGAAGLEPLMEAFSEGTTKKEAKSFIADKIDAVYQHGDGDYILKEKASKERKYKGHIISKVSTGWMVDAYDESFKTLKEARDFISLKVSGTAKANQQCVRVMPGGKRCIGTVVFVRSKRYKCDTCGAEYREA